MSRLNLWLLGPPRIESESGPVEIQRRKALALLVYVAVTGESQPRDSLAALLWPESDKSSARMALRRDLSALNRALGRTWLEINRERVGLERKPGLWLDVEQFQWLLATCRSHGHPAGEGCPVCLPLLSEAVELYRADFLTGFTLPDSPEFDEWQFFQVESFRRELASALERLARVYGVQGDAERELAISYARRWLTLDPLHEPAHQQLMQLYAWAGQQALALRQYRECGRLLGEELGLAPAVETTELFEAIKARRISTPPSLTATPPSPKVYAASGPPAPPPQLPSFLKPKETEPIDLEQPIFVAREHELAQLDAFLDLALAGRGQVVFVIGEAGRGKTALVQEFTRQAQVRQADLIVAGGNCNAYTGLGDPYLPFREILGLLTGDVEVHWAAGAISQAQAQRLWAFMPHAAEVLINSGPDLIDTFIPGSALLARAATAAPEPTGWLTQLEALVARRATGQIPANVQQSDLFEQYARVMQTVTGRQPLLLVVDDLQWADGGSINLLFHLGRRLEGSRVLMVGIYRPAEVAPGREGQRHPLEALVHEFQRQFGNILIDLSQAEGRRFVNAFVETEPNRLGPEFREALYQHTRGHALFTVEMLRGMQERGDLVRDEQGQWVEGPALNWEILPARVEGVIGERVGRLPARLQEVLKIASIEGELFRAEVVARLQAVDERTMIRQLSGELDKQHRLVRGQGSQRVDPGGQRLSHYRFRHILFQRYLYNDLDEVERAYLHEAVGAVLEALYGDQTEPVAVQLARHFEQAGLTEKAVTYLLQAGKRASQLSAHEEAIAHLTKGLTLLATLPDTPERAQHELSLQIALGNALVAVKGYAAPEVGQTFSRARELCQKIGETPQLLWVLHGLHRFYLVRGELHTARELGEQLLRLAQHQQDPIFLVPAHRVMGATLFLLGEFVPAQTHFEQGLRLYDPQQYHTYALLYGQDEGVAGLAYAGWALWFLGYPDQALQRSSEALTLAQKLAHPFSLAYALNYIAWPHRFRREARVTQERAEAAVTLATERGFSLWVAGGMMHRGWALTEQGQGEEGLVQLRQGLAAWRDTGAEWGWHYFLGLLVEAHAKMGQVKEGLVVVDEALAAVPTTGRFWEAELYRLKGELLLKDEGGRMKDEVEACFLQGIEVARRQGAKSLELRAVMSLSRLWQQQGKQGEARRKLAEIYGWFTEGFDTADLREAKALLEAWRL